MNSYSIRRLWKKISGNTEHPKTRSASVVRAPLKKIILANRVDGFGERLCAMINAIRFADHLEADFRFTWTDQIWNHVYTQTDPSTPTQILGQSIAPMEQVFDPDFIEAYAMRHEAADLFEPLPTQSLTAQELKKSATRGWYTTQHHIAVDYGATVAQACALLSSEAFDKIIFSADIRNAIKQARDLDLGDFTALHLRSGDMVYGEVRKWGFWGNKVLNPVVAMEIIKRTNAEGIKIVVFGQDINWIRQIQTDHNVVVAHDLLADDTPSHVRAVFEMVLLSRAAQIVAGDSGFARAASMIGDKPVKDMFAVYGPITYSDITLAGMEALQTNLHPFMAAYAYWQAYAFGRTLRSVPQLISIIEKSHALDPENDLYFVILAALKYRLGHDQDAEKLLAARYAQDPAGMESAQHPLNQQITFRYYTPKYTHEEQFVDFIAAARRPGNTCARHIAKLIQANKS